MKKLLGIVVLGLLWCNVNAVAEEKKVYFCTDNPEYISSAWLPFISKEPCEYTEITAAEYVEEIINAYGKKTEVIQSLYNDFQSHNLDTNIVKKIAEQKTQDTESSFASCIKGNCVNGQGTSLLSNGSYTGQWENGKANGLGTFEWDDGSKYVGYWKDNDQHGQGTYTYSDGKILNGIWKKNKLVKPNKVGISVAKESEEKNLDFESSLPKCKGSPIAEGSIEEKSAVQLLKMLARKDPYSSFTKNWNNCHGVIDLDGMIIHGEYKNGKLLQGTFTFEGDKYVGEFNKGYNPHGQGTYVYANGDKYVGEYKNGSKDGQGTYTFPDGTEYVGEWKDNKYHGQGTLKKADGQKYVGEFKNNFYDGQGTLIAPGFGEYTGQFKDNLPNGKVVITIIEDDSYGDLSGSIYEGEVKNAMPTYGTLTYKNGDKYIGNFKEGQPNGKGTFTYADGKIKKGIWKDGELVK